MQHERSCATSAQKRSQEPIFARPRAIQSEPKALAEARAENIVEERLLRCPHTAGDGWMPSISSEGCLRDRLAMSAAMEVGGEAGPIYPRGHATSGQSVMACVGSSQGPHAGGLPVGPPLRPVGSLQATSTLVSCGRSIPPMHRATGFRAIFKDGPFNHAHRTLTCSDALYLASTRILRRSR